MSRDESSKFFTHRIFLGFLFYPYNIRDFSFLAPCPSSGLIVHGDKDNIASFDSTKILVEKLQKQKKVDIKFNPIKGADHFYENYSSELENSVKDYIQQTLPKD